MVELPRSEYPRPQFVRTEWQSLNGDWQFEFDDDREGVQKKWHKGDIPLSQNIKVPFAFQSSLSGIGINDFHDVVWYRRTFVTPENWCEKRVVLHFGAVDYTTQVWVNGELVVVHEGGHTPFAADITDALTGKENVLVVRAEDFSTDLSLPRGKQSWKPESARIFYTRTTGIWQTVWMEAVEDTYLEKVHFTPDIDRGEVQIRSWVKSIGAEDVHLKVRITFEGRRVAEDVWLITDKVEFRTIHLQDFNGFQRCHLWSPEAPNLYDVEFELYQDGQLRDKVTSYFGMRKISTENGNVLLNNRKCFLKLVLDQGYYPDGNLTPPSDAAIRRDVELIKELGFNGARKHQKIEDPRYLYWCDKLGLLVWGESPSAYLYTNDYVRRFTREWQEVIDRDYNHPCIIAWVPLNESWGVNNIKTNKSEQHHALTMYHLVKSLDLTRLVVSNDGWEQTQTDLVTIHDYEHRQTVLEERYRTVACALTSVRNHSKQVFVGGYQYEGQPILVSECGGIGYKKSGWNGWGYSTAANDEDFLERLKAIMQPLMNAQGLQGFCYTQLTDVEQEINGLLNYDRSPKIPIDEIRTLLIQP